MDVLLTGVPRSGTTLTCELLNRLPDVVALDEPLDVGSFTADHPLMADRIEGSVAALRESIRSSGRAPSWEVEGRVFAGRIADDGGGEVPRTSLATRGTVEIDKSLSPSFLLVVKHPAAFTAMLDTLVERFTVYATVRNPLSVLSSWQTVPLSVKDGYLPVAEQMDSALGEALGAIDDRLDRQIHLLAWCFEKYRDVLREDQVIRYESIVESDGHALNVITERASELGERLESRNKAGVYDRETMRRLGERLLETDGPYWDFYTKESVTELLD